MVRQMRVRAGLTAGLCVIRVTRRSADELLITVTTAPDVTRGPPESSQNVTDVAAALEIVTTFLAQWQSVPDR
jgi:hypothetical protein